MNSFNKEISANEPSLRVGTVIPDNTVNLAYVNGPELVSEDTVELYDYSTYIPENTVATETFKRDYIVGEGRVLKTEQGSAVVPVENILTTSVYKELPDKTWAPLFYHYKTRFMHYEKNPPYTLDNTPNQNYRVYLGHNIRVMLNNVPVTGNYIVCLEVPPQPVTPLDNPDDCLTWIVHIFSEFTSSQDEYYTVEYSKWNATKKVPEHNYEEIYNSEPYYIKSSKEDVLAATDGKNQFAVEKLSSADGYRVYVSDDIDPLGRTPVLVRWRIKDSDGRYSTWKSDELLRKESLYPEDYGTSRLPVYVVEDLITKKILCQDVSSLFETYRAPFTVEWQKWDGAQWIDYVSSDITFELNSNNRLAAWTTINTGTIIDTPGKVSYKYDFTPTDITIEGWLDPPDITYTPVIETNVAKTSKGATASADVGSGWAWYTSASNAIDGYNPMWMIFLGLVDDNRGAFCGRSPETSNAPQQDIVVTVNLANPTTELKKIQVVMGLHGTPVKLEVKNTNNQWSTLWNSTPSPSLGVGWWSSGTPYTWQVDTGLQNINQIKLTIRPSVWYVRSGWQNQFLWWRWGEIRYYQSGWDLYEINAYDYYNPPDIVRNWNKKISIGFNISKATPMTLDAGLLLQRYGMIPTDPELQDSLQNLHYRITLGDTTGTTVTDYDPHVSITAYRQTFTFLWWTPSMKQIAAEGANGSIYFNYTDAISVYSKIMLKISGCKEDAYYARQFTVITQKDNKIYLKRFESMGKDEMWLPVVNNGRIMREEIIDREDLKKHVMYDYYIPEYYRQPFYPEAPYIYVEREEAQYIDSSTIRVKHKPLHVTYDNDGQPTNLKVYLDINNVITEIPVVSWNMYTGDIKIDHRINFTDRIFVDYHYICYALIYKGCGFLSTNKFHYLDLNPMPGHTYIDDNGVERPSSDLLNKSVWIYITPVFSLNRLTGETKALSIMAVKHRIFDRTMSEQEAITTILNDPFNDNQGAIILGRIDVKKPAVPSLIVVTDSRRRGGGFKDKISKEALAKEHSEALYTWDVGCFPAGAEVLTQDGMKKIETIQKGDKVYTHTGNLNTVSETMSRDTDKLVSIGISGMSDKMVCTPNHPVLAIKSAHLNLRSRDLKNRIVKNKLSPQWIRADELAIGDLVYIPKRTNLAPCNFTEDQLYTMGWWLAEGSFGKEETCSGNILVFSIGKEEAERTDCINRIVKTLTEWDTDRNRLTKCSSGGLGGLDVVHLKGPVVRYREDKHYYEITSNSIFLVDLFRALFGSDSRNKHIGSELFNCSGLLPLVCGWIDGERHYRKNYGQAGYSVRSFSVSHELVAQMRQILIDNGIYCIMQHEPKTGNGGWSIVISHKYLKDLQYCKKLHSRPFKKSSSRAIEVPSGFYVPIKDICIFDEKTIVYNMEVDNDNSYVVCGIAVHNSWDGEPYPSNGVIEVTVPESLLKENGGKFEREEIEQMINQHVAFGVYTFVQYKK